jgi:hypothetical protein
MKSQTEGELGKMQFLYPVYLNQENLNIHMWTGVHNNSTCYTFLMLSYSPVTKCEASSTIIKLQPVDKLKWLVVYLITEIGESKSSIF